MSSTETDNTALRTYRGNCHCGAFVYEAQLPELTTVTECNCSICTKKGYLGVDNDAVAHFKVVKGSLEDLSEYSFGSKSFQHKVGRLHLLVEISLLTRLLLYSFAQFAQRPCLPLDRQQRLARTFSSMYVYIDGGSGSKP